MKRLLQIGTGRWGVNHLRVLRSLPVEVFVSDLLPQAFQKCCAPLGIAADHFSTDHRKFLESVDAVDIVTPAPTHFALVQEALGRGKDVFVEKPITVSSEEAGVLAGEARKRGRILQVGHIFRFDPAVEWLRSAIREERFGKLRMLRARFAGFKRPRNDSGVLLADGIHFLDLMTFLLDRLPSRVTASFQDFLGRGMEDEAWVGLEYGKPDPLWATIECGYHLPGKAREVLVVGSEMSALCDLNAPELKVTTFPNRHVRENGGFKAVEGEAARIGFPTREPLLAELAAFVDSLTTRKAPSAGGEAGYRSMKLVEAAFASAREGRSMEVEEAGPALPA